MNSLRACPGRPHEMNSGSRPLCPRFGRVEGGEQCARPLRLEVEQLGGGVNEVVEPGATSQRFIEPRFHAFNGLRLTRENFECEFQRLHLVPALLTTARVRTDFSLKRRSQEPQHVFFEMLARPRGARP